MLFAFYGNDGKIESSGYTCNGGKDGHWYYYIDSITVWQTEEYHNGKLTYQDGKYVKGFRKQPVTIQ